MFKKYYQEYYPNNKEKYKKTNKIYKEKNKDILEKKRRKERPLQEIKTNRKNRPLRQITFYKSIGNILVDFN